MTAQLRELNDDKICSSATWFAKLIHEDDVSQDVTGQFLTLRSCFSTSKKNKNTTTNITQTSTPGVRSGSGDATVDDIILPHHPRLPMYIDNIVCQACQNVQLLAMS